MFTTIAIANNLFWNEKFLTGELCHIQFNIFWFSSNVERKHPHLIDLNWFWFHLSNFLSFSCLVFALFLFYFNLLGNNHSKWILEIDVISGYPCTVILTSNRLKLLLMHPCRLLISNYSYRLDHTGLIVCYFCEFFENLLKHSKMINRDRNLKSLLH